MIALYAIQMQLYVQVLLITNTFNGSVPVVKFILFICGLFNHFINISECITLIHRAIDEVN